MRVSLIEIRKRESKTQNDVAIELGISRAYYAMIENGSRNPTLDLAKKISDLFKTDMESIFFNY